MKVSLVPAHEVMNVWQKVSGYLDAASKTVKQRCDIVDIYEDCLVGRQLLWIMFDDAGIHGAMTTSVTKYPRYTALTVPYMGGRGIWKMRDEIMKTLISFAKDNQFETIECFGRDEWLRIGQKYGFKKALTVFELEVNNE